MTLLNALSPLDGRYRQKIAPLVSNFSESALIRYRLQVEISWLIALSEAEDIPEVRALSAEECDLLQNIVRNFDDNTASAVKEIERVTNHDVKAVEYHLKQCMANTSLAPLREFVHFACTSEDINNLAHGLMLKHGVGDVWVEKAEALLLAIESFAKQHQQTPMLAHTHGQPASPTTVGKEMNVFVHRLKRQLKIIQNQTYFGKLNGAVGNFNAHLVAYPNVDWLALTRKVVEVDLDLTYNPYTTQIESHDYMAELFQAIARFNTILIDFDCDVWLYISRGYFKERVKENEVGSSTMPHKVNPIDFENSEGNLGIANALLNFLAQKLSISRLQRDLSDSTVIRNMGVAIGHSYVALQSTIRGIGKLSVNEDILAQELDANWEVLSEAVQTVMRKAGIDNPYEQLKAMTRGKRLDRTELQSFINQLPIDDADKARLLALTPASYLGNASVF
ncbi:MAG: adenylosuccinate lyase [Chloroflexota bacterium]